MHTHVQNIKNIFLYPPLSAKAPISGDKIAINTEEIDTTLPHKIEPLSGVEAIKSTKNVE